MLQLQLAVLRADAAFANLRARVVDVAERLSEKDSIPMVREQMALIQEIQTDEFWQGVTAPILEGVRKKLRALVKLIEKTSRKPVYTDFEDQIGTPSLIDLPGFEDGFERFRTN